MSQYRKIRNTIIALLGGRCSQCGFTDPRALQIDHVFGDGGEERDFYGSGVSYLKHILADVHSGRYQILCSNHNAIKKITNFEDRHFNLDAVYDLETVFT